MSTLRNKQVRDNISVHCANDKVVPKRAYIYVQYNHNTLLYLFRYIKLGLCEHKSRKFVIESPGLLPVQSSKEEGRWYSSICGDAQLLSVAYIVTTYE